MVEHLSEEQGVPGSSTGGATKYLEDCESGLFSLFAKQVAM